MNTDIKTYTLWEWMEYLNEAVEMRANFSVGDIKGAWISDTHMSYYRIEYVAHHVHVQRAIRYDDTISFVKTLLPTSFHSEESVICELVSF